MIIVHWFIVECRMGLVCQWVCHGECSQLAHRRVYSTTSICTYVCMHITIYSISSYHTYHIHCHYYYYHYYCYCDCNYIMMIMWYVVCDCRCAMVCVCVHESVCMLVSAIVWWNVLAKVVVVCMCYLSCTIYTIYLYHLYYLYYLYCVY